MAIQYWRVRDRYYRLVGSKCEKCDAEFFPPVYICRRCGSDRIKDAEMPKSGSILTYTVLHEPLPGFEAEAPMALGLVKLDNGTKVLGQIVDSSEESIRTGVKVRAIVRRVRVDGDSGQIVYGYKFVVTG